MGYSSDIDLGGLGESPKTQNAEAFQDFVDVYNAIHILAQYVNSVINRPQGSGDADTPPWEAMRFERWFYAPAAVHISAGAIVTPVDYDGFHYGRYGGSTFYLKGLINGVAPPELRPSYTSTGPLEFKTLPLMGGFTGYALTSGGPGELIQVGVGPAILNSAGIKAGEPVFAEAAYKRQDRSGTYVATKQAELFNRGDLIKLPPEGVRATGRPGGLYCVGVGVADGAFMLTLPNLIPNALQVISRPPPETDFGGGGNS